MQNNNATVQMREHVLSMINWQTIRMADFCPGFTLISRSQRHPGGIGGERFKSTSKAYAHNSQIPVNSSQIRSEILGQSIDLISSSYVAVQNMLHLQRSSWALYGF